MDKCCATTPRILCRVCKVSACMKHMIVFKRNHPPANILAPTGREMFTCGEKLVSFIIENSVVVFICPDELHDNFSALTNQPRPNPDAPKPKRKNKLAWD